MCKKGIITKASYTVEAALVMPIVIFTVISLIYMAFYMHDKSRIKAVIDIVAIQSGLLIKHETEMKSEEINYEHIDYEHIDERGIYFPVIGSVQREQEEMELILDEVLSKGLFIAKIENINIDVDHSKIHIEVQAAINITILKVKDLLGKGGTHITISTEGQVHYPAEFVRKFNSIEGIIEDVNGYDKVVLKLQDVIVGKK